MNRLFKVLSLFFVVAISSSCAKNHIEELKKDSKILVDATKKVALISMDNLMLYEFDKEFSKNFESKKQYSDFFTKSFETKLISDNLFQNVTLIEGTSDVMSIFDTNDYDYILSIEDVKIMAYFEDSQNTSYSANIGNSNKKKSYVRARIKIYDKVAKQPIAEFYASGESDYSEKNYKKVVESATEIAIKNTMTYLKTGKTKF